MGKEAFLNTGISHSRPRRSGFSWRVWCGSVSSAHTPHHRASVHPGRFHCPLQTSSRALIKTTLHELIRSESSASITSLPRGPASRVEPLGGRDPGAPITEPAPLAPAGVGKTGPSSPRRQQPAAVFWPGEPHGQRSRVGYGLWGCQEPDTTERWRFSSSGKFSASAGCSLAFFCREHIIKHRIIWVTEAPVTVHLTW